MHTMTWTSVRLRRGILRMLAALVVTLLCVGIDSAPGVVAQGPPPSANRAVSPAHPRAMALYRTAHERRVAARLDALLYTSNPSTSGQWSGARYRAAHEQRVAARLAR